MDVFKNLGITNVLKKFKKFIAPEIKGLIKRKLGLIEKSLQNDPFQELKNIPRYTQTTLFFKEREIVIPDSASFLFMQKEIFEQHIYKFQAQNPEPYIIDGGANIGLATIYLKLLYPSSTILAFEPDPKIFRILEKNIKSFKFKEVELFQKGLWDKEAQLDFWSEGADGNLLTELDKTKKKNNSIETISLRPFLKKKVDFLKLDIEGAETVVLRDIKNELANVERIFIEYHSFVGQPQTLNEVVEILTTAGYRLHISSPGLSSKSPFMKLNVYNNMDMQLNIYGYKEEIY